MSDIKLPTPDELRAEIVAREAGTVTEAMKTILQEMKTWQEADGDIIKVDLPSTLTKGIQTTILNRLRMAGWSGDFTRASTGINESALRLHIRPARVEHQERQ